MKDQQQLPDKDHWRAIAEQLGLAPEGEASSQSKEPTTSELGRPEHRAGNRDTDTVRPPPGDQSHGVETSLERAPEEQKKPPSSETPVEESEAKPGERKSRRRPSRGTEESRTSEERSPRAKRDGKGRGRKKRTRTDSKEEPHERLEAHEQSVPAESEPVDDDDEGYGNWSVPSWSELIASLYKPER